MICPANGMQEVKMTTPSEIGYREAILIVLQDADGPLKYDTITQIIGERGIRTLTGATPAITVNAYLSNMTNPDHQWYDERISRLGRGWFEFIRDDAVSAVEADHDDLDDQDADEEAENPNKIVRVSAFGLYWEKGQVSWRSREILGRQPGATLSVNFADQKGVYILHNDRSIVYVGRTTDSLYARLRYHNRDTDRKSVRWNKFSWFGFRDVNPDTGELMPLPGEIDPFHLITILEAVLIEALEPPVNGRRGDYIGTPYQQVIDPKVAQSQARSLLQNLIG